MLIIPAIDLLNGNAVRLKQGDMDDYKKYFNNPLDAAKIFTDNGIKRMHIVDLDGAKSGDTINFKVIESIANNVNIEMEVGGGIRNIERINSYFNIGVKYAILGTAVVKNPDFVKAALEEFPDRVILGIDAKDGFVATDGWYEKSNISALEAIEIYKDFKVESIIYTDISRDGMLKGLNVGKTVELSEKAPFPVIASGGLKNIDDVIALKGNKNIKGCIVGKAFYEGKIDLKQAIQVAGE